jgi:hypothetical protein
VTVTEGRGIGAIHRNPALHSSACNKATKTLAWFEKATDNAGRAFERAKRANADGSRPFYEQSTARTFIRCGNDERRAQASRDDICKRECGRGAA